MQDARCTGPIDPVWLLFLLSNSHQEHPQFLYTARWDLSLGIDYIWNCWPWMNGAKASISFSLGVAETSPVYRGKD